VKPLSVLPVLESHHAIVSETHGHNLTARVPTPPLLGPQVEDVVRIDVGKQRRNRSSLRNAFVERRPRPFLDDPRGHPLLDQPQDPLIRDPVLNKPLQPLMVKAGEVVPEIQVEHPAHLPLDPDRERVQRLMWAASGPEPVGEPEEVRLIHGVQHLDHRPLQDLVLQRRDPERPQPPVRLRYVRPPRRSCPVCAPVDTGMKIAKVRFEVLAVVLPRHAIDPRRGLGLERPVGSPQAFDVDVVQERGESCILVLLCHSAHAIQLAWRALPGSGSGARFAGRVPLGWSPSLHHLRHPALGIVRQLRR
jgi:hypothetical protein